MAVIRTTRKAKSNSALTQRSANSGVPLTGKVKRIKYECRSACVPTPRHCHMAPGDVVVLIAMNTDVEIKFDVHSPFVSGEKDFTIDAGEVRIEIVGARAGSYGYNLDCMECKSSKRLPCEMIVP